MWKFILFLAISISSSYAADLYCSSFSASLQCIFDKLINVASATDTINVSGQSATYRDFETTRFFASEMSQFESFPINLLNVFPNLTYFQATGNNMNTMTTNSFGSCGKLETILLHGQKFTNLPASVGQNCASLKSFNIFNSQLATLDPNALLGLNAVQFVQFVNCKIKCIPIGFFSNVPSVTNIYFSGNQIVTIDSAMFKGLPKLSFVNFVFNPIAYYPSLNLTGTGTVGSPARLELHFEGNPTTAVNPQLLDNMFTGRTDPLAFYAGALFSQTLSSCFPGFIQVASNNDWSTVESSFYTTCINNYTPALDNQTILCGTVFTTTSTTTAPSQPPTLPPTAPPTTITIISPTTAQPITSPSTPPCSQKSIIDIIIHEARNFSVNFP